MQSAHNPANTRPTHDYSGGASAHNALISFAKQALLNSCRKIANRLNRLGFPIDALPHPLQKGRGMRMLIPTHAMGF